MKAKWKWLPPWDMPSDPVRAVFWFSRWFLQVLVRYFAIPVLAGVAYETYLNGIVGLVGTLIVGLLVWALLAAILTATNVASGAFQVYTEISQLRRNPFSFNDLTRRTPEKDANVVEGSIITDLEEERRKRRHEL